MRILIAGVGNVLRGDDGFGVEVARRMAALDLPVGVRVVETGIGGIALVHEVAAGCDALVVADAIDRGRPPGTVMVIEPEVVDVAALSLGQRHDMLADMHLATPDRAFMLARALGALPPSVILVGCQPLDAETFQQGLSAPVARAIPLAVEEIRRQVGLAIAAGGPASPAPARP
ncbi:MAG: hydrogenase maturation protease [Acidimicrobiales bacterium]